MIENLYVHERDARASGGKIDYEAKMVADYDHKELSEDGFNPKHTL